MNTKPLYGKDYKAMKRRRRKQAIQRKKSLEATRGMVMVCNKIFYIIGLMCISLAIATGATCAFMRQYYQNEIYQQQQEIIELQLENQKLLDKIDGFSDTYTETVSVLEDVSEIAYELDQENDNLVTQANELQETINSYEERERNYLINMNMLLSEKTTLVPI